MIFDLFKKTNIALSAPATGTLKELTQVADEVFSSKSIGDGFAVVPSDGIVVAPIGGIVTMIFPTGHAMGISDGNGLELLIHVGIDSVLLKGEGFSVKVAEGQHVKAGETLLCYDLSLLQERVPSTDVIVVATSGQSCTIEGPGRNVYAGEKNIAAVRGGD